MRLRLMLPSMDAPSSPEVRKRVGILQEKKYRNRSPYPERQRVCCASPTSKTEGVASTLQLICIEGRLELPGNVWVNSLVGVYHLRPRDLRSSSHTNLQG